MSTLSSKKFSKLKKNLCWGEVIQVGWGCGVLWGVLLGLYAWGWSYIIALYCIIVVL